MSAPTIEVVVDVTSAHLDILCDVGRRAMWAHLPECPSPADWLLGVHSCRNPDRLLYVFVCHDHLRAILETRWPVVCDCPRILSRFEDWAPILRRLR